MLGASNSTGIVRIPRQKTNRSGRTFKTIICLNKRFNNFVLFIYNGSRKKKKKSKIIEYKYYLRDVAFPAGI